ARKISGELHSRLPLLRADHRHFWAPGTSSGLCITGQSTAGLCITIAGLSTIEDHRADHLLHSSGRSSISSMPGCAAELARRAEHRCRAEHSHQAKLGRRAGSVRIFILKTCNKTFYY
ncbi:hypothetical protein Dimus_002816, partial [Dionaea muscipula]